MKLRPEPSEPNRRDECVRVLSRLRRGELAVMATYSRAIAKGGPSGKHLVELRLGHEAAAAALHRRVTELGGAIEASAGLSASFSSAVKGATKILGGSSATEALRQGEKRGVVGYARALADQRVDRESWQLLRVAFARQQACLGAFEGLVGPRSSVDRPPSPFRQLRPLNKEPQHPMDNSQDPHDVNPEAGKVGLAILMWFLGVPGLIVLLYMIFGR